MAEIFYHESTSQNLTPCPSVVTPRARASAPIRQRRSRTMFTEVDIARLEAAFVLDPYPDINAREEMAEAIGVAEARIQTWFQNKRSRNRRKMNNNRSSVGTPSRPSPPRQGGPSSSSATAGNALSHHHFQRQTPLTYNQENIRPSTNQNPATPASSAVTGGRNDLSMSRRSSRTAAPQYALTPPGMFRPSPVSSATSSPIPSDAKYNDSGILDLSSRSTEEASPSLHTSASHPEANRPFFTPWATNTTSSAFKPPTTVASPLLLPASHAPHQQLRLPFAPPMGFPNPWFYGFAPRFNPQETNFYLQPLPASPFLQYLEDLPRSPFTPGSSPVLQGLTPPFSTPQNNIFVFPDVRSSNRGSPLAMEQTSPEPSPRPAAVELEGHVSTSSSSSAASSPNQGQDALSGSPASDAGSGSSGYSSRETDSPINVCD